MCIVHRQHNVYNIHNPVYEYDPLAIGNSNKRVSWFSETPPHSLAPLNIIIITHQMDSFSSNVHIRLSNISLSFGFKIFLNYLIFFLLYHHFFWTVNFFWFFTCAFFLVVIIRRSSRRTVLENGGHEFPSRGYSHLRAVCTTGDLVIHLTRSLNATTNFPVQ